MNTLLFKSKTDKVGIALFVLFLVLTVASIYQIAYGRVTDLRSDIVVATEESVDVVAVHMDLLAQGAATSTILVDLSDTTNFPHRATGAIEVTKIIVDWDANDAASTTLKFGVLASTTGGTAGGKTDVYWFDKLEFNVDAANVTGRDRGQVKVLDYSPAAIKTDLVNGAPNSFLTSDKLMFTTAYATSSALMSPYGSSTNRVSPANGDLLMQVFLQQGTASTSVTVFYKIR